MWHRESIRTAQDIDYSYIILTLMRVMWREAWRCVDGNRPNGYPRRSRLQLNEWRHTLGFHDVIVTTSPGPQLLLLIVMTMIRVMVRRPVTLLRHLLRRVWFMSDQLISNDRSPVMFIGEWRRFDDCRVIRMTVNAGFCTELHRDPCITIRTHAMLLVHKTWPV